MKKLHIVVLHRTYLLIAAAAVAIAALLAPVLSGTGMFVSVSAAKRDLPIYYVKADDKVCSVTFDAAWGAEDTQTLIDILGKYKVRATFFLVGQWVDKYPDMVKKLYEAGHEIANHSDTHPHMTQLSAEKMTEEVLECGKKIEAVTGVKPYLFRPPYGDYNDRVVSSMREAGYYTIQWNVDSLDWKDPTPTQIADRVLSKTVPGSIILFHNGAKNTPAALPALLEGLISNGYTFKPVSELIYKENFTIAHDGRQEPK